jgi:hypothetical protein
VQRLCSPITTIEEEEPMTELFRALGKRVAAILAAHAALELKAEALTAHVERKAALLQRAAKLDAEGLSDLATELRNFATETDPRRPAEATLPALTSTSGVTSPTSALPTPATFEPETPAQTPAGNGRKGKR